MVPVLLHHKSVHPINCWITLYSATPGSSPSVIYQFTHVNCQNTGCNAPVYSRVVVYTGKPADYTSYLV